jgi:NADH:ubiquinone oxidoreductase subunit 3 (subunit A)
MKNESFESDMPDFDDAARAEKHLKKMGFQYVVFVFLYIIFNKGMV